MPNLYFEEWISATQKHRDELDEFGKSHLPSDISERHADQDSAIQNRDDAERLLADAKWYLIQKTAQETLWVKNNHIQLSADERKIIVKDRVKDVQHLVDGIKVTCDTIQARIFHSMNANRAR